MIEKAETLLPCPFCGSRARLVRTKAEYFVQCTRLGTCYGKHSSLAHEGYTYEADAIEIWNRRELQCAAVDSALTDYRQWLVSQLESQIGCSQQNYAAMEAEGARIDFDWRERNNARRYLINFILRDRRGSKMSPICGHSEAAINGGES